MKNIHNKDGPCKWFRFGLKGDCNMTLEMKARNGKVRKAQLAAFNCILSNQVIGDVISVKNFARITVAEYGFSRMVIESVLRHSHDIVVIEWTGEDTKSSTIRYLPLAKQYLPENIVHYPPRAIEASIKNKKTGKRSKVAVTLNTKFKVSLDKRIRTFWKFIKKHNIQHNVDTETFLTVMNYRKIVERKDGDISFPDKHYILPVAVFNDRTASIGGRFYRAFWIGMPKILRPLITIDGELTCDIDGCAMHVQLLYQKAGVPVPDVELYIYTDERRKITKRLMLYMMNTRKDWQGDSGRIAVIKTYKKHHTVKGDLMLYILELEEIHRPILHLLYKSNWGELQRTEAGLMLQIIEAAMKEDILVLPVHDGCLCQRKHRDRVLELFADLHITAKENMKHLDVPDFTKMKESLEVIKLATKRLKLLCGTDIHTENLAIVNT